MSYKEMIYSILEGLEADAAELKIIYRFTAALVLGNTGGCI